MATTNIFSNVPTAPEDQMFGLKAAYAADAFPQKVDLGPGAYRDENARPWVLPTVKKAEKLIQLDSTVNHEYLPISGLPEFTAASQRLVFGNNSPAIHDNRIASVQALSGTGALHLGAKLLARFGQQLSSRTVHVTTPPYVNHLPLLQAAALDTALYPYYSSKTQSLDIDGMRAHLDSISPGSIVLLHACAHNPTGLDPSRDQWRQIAEIMKTKGHLPFFDFAYQGFASGSLDDDAWVIRYFMQQGFDNLMVAQSYAKNLGLYGERAGCLHVVTNSSDMAKKIHSQLLSIQRVTVSSPPAYGARIAATVLNNEELYQSWQTDLRTMAGRISTMRWKLREELEKRGVPGTWNHITDQIGMFSYTGLSQTQVKYLRDVYHVYATPDGRFSIAGLNPNNVGYVAEAIAGAVNRSRL